MTLANDIARELDAAIASASGELAITKKFIENLSRLSTAPDIKIETAFCHQKPYAHFVSPSHYANKKKCELGDILWMFKTIYGGTVSDQRVIFTQVKHSYTSVFHIEQHQYQFLLDINNNSFEFGRSVYRKGGYQPITFNRITKSMHFSNYLFLTPTLTPKCESTSNLNPPTTTSFNTAALASFEIYIGNFLQNQSFGMNILHNKLGWKLTDIVCKRLGLVLDPNEEWEGYFEDEKPGFGVVLITVVRERG